MPPIAGADGIAIAYPKALRDAGVQGSTVVSFTVGVDGLTSDPVIESSSRSDELDAGVLKAVAAHTFKPGTVDGQPVAMRYKLPVEFKKDDIVNLRDKTCSDLTVDVAYFRKTFPELPLDDMWISKLARSLKTFLSDPPAKAAKDFADRQRRVKEAFGRSVEWCAANPDALFVAEFNREAG